MLCIGIPCGIAEFCHIVIKQFGNGTFRRGIGGLDKFTDDGVHVDGAFAKPFYEKLFRA